MVMQPLIRRQVHDAHGRNIHNEEVQTGNRWQEGGARCPPAEIDNKEIDNG